MKKHVFILGLGVFLLFVDSYNAIAQGPSTKYNENQKESDDVKFTVKTNIMSVVASELPLSFEYKFIKNLGVEAGIGLILPYYVNLEFFSVFKINKLDDFVFFTKCYRNTILSSSVFLLNEYGC